MATHRTIDIDRPRRSNESVRANYRSSQPQGISPTSPTSPRVRFSDDEPVSTATIKKSPSVKSKGARVIRTFEEIDKIVPKEEWYEELECGICSHILGAPQGLVPCGHSFCGPCAWTWIKVNGNHTCPHCRVPVNETIPLIPNIVVDQIIDRKLAGLPDGKEKEGLIQERASKSGDWKVLQTSIVPPKPPPSTPRRTGRAMGMINGFFDANQTNWGNNGRRSSRQDDIVEEPIEDPNPRRRSAYAGMSLAQAARRGMEEDQTRRTSGGRRLGLDSDPAQQSHAGYMVSPNGVNQSPNRPRLVARTSSNGSTLEQHRQRQRESSISNGSPDRPNLSIRTAAQSPNIEPVSAVLNTPEARRSITRSRALASRQGRYRNGESREAPILVESESDGEQ